MKKIISILTVAILTLMISSFKSPFQPSYGPWRTTSCFKGIDFCVKRASYNESVRKYEWWVKFRNRYQEDVAFNCALKESNIFSAKGTERITVRASSESGGTWFLIADANSVNVFIDALRFGDDVWGTPYVKCDN